MLLVPKKKIDFSNSFEYLTYIFNSSTPCIIKEEDRYIILNRCNHNFTHMINQVLYMDMSFNIIDYKIIPHTFQNKLTCDGIEDIRIFSYKNTLYFLGLLRINSKYKVLYDIFDPSKELPHSEITVGFPTKYYVEKNWVFVQWREKLCIIYKWYPLTICEVVNNILVVLEEHTMPEACKDFSGSSSGVLYKNEIWFVVHYHKGRNYKHVFVILDTNLNFLYCSKPFQFETTREFSYGLIIENDEILVSYSTNNNSSKACVYDYNTIRNEIIGCSAS